MGRLFSLPALVSSVAMKTSYWQLVSKHSDHRPSARIDVSDLFWCRSTRDRLPNGARIRQRPSRVPRHVPQPQIKMLFVNKGVLCPTPPLAVGDRVRPVRGLSQPSSKARAPSDLADAFSVIVEKKLDGVVIASDAMLFNERQRIGELENGRYRVNFPQ
jgi:hypothetical protein